MPPTRITSAASRSQSGWMSVVHHPEWRRKKRSEQSEQAKATAGSSNNAMKRRVRRIPRDNIKGRRAPHVSLGCRAGADAFGASPGATHEHRYSGTLWRGTLAHLWDAFPIVDVWVEQAKDTTVAVRVVRALVLVRMAEKWL